MGMGRRLEVAGHLSVMELFEWYRGAGDPAVKARLREVARRTGFRPARVRQLVRRYNADGPKSLGAPGGGHFLTADDDEALHTRDRPGYDGVEPSGNSVAAMNLLRLAEFGSDEPPASSPRSCSAPSARSSRTGSRCRPCCRRATTRSTAR